MPSRRPRRTWSPAGRAWPATAGPSRRRLRRHRLAERDEDLDHARALDLLDGDDQLGRLPPLALARHAAEEVQHPAPDGVVGLVGDAQSGGGVEILHRELAGDAE